MRARRCAGFCDAAYGLRRIGEAEEIGRAASWLASDFSDYWSERRFSSTVA
jgi:hypothetical protein